MIILQSYNKINNLEWPIIMTTIKPYSLGHNYVLIFFSVSHTIAMHLPHMMSLAMNNEHVMNKVTASHLYGRSCTKMNSSSNVSDSTDHALNVEAKVISLNNSNTNNPYTPKRGFQHVYKSKKKPLQAFGFMQTIMQL